MSDEVSTIQGSAIEYSDEAAVFEGYVVTPRESTERRPCVLLTHEWSGLNEGMRDIAHRVAALGYTCFAIDVYGKGVRGDQRSDNSHLMNPLLEDRLLLRRRLLAGWSAARAHPSVQPESIVALGYCFGGLCALDLARAGADLVGVISIHGVLQPPRIATAKHIEASVLLLHGWEDPVTPPGDVLAIARELTDAGADWQLHAYGHAMHAFTYEGLNFPERGLAYNENAARRAWSTVVQFLNEKIGPSTTSR